jgi:energy-converting hydrogenase Eha subunit B
MDPLRVVEEYLVAVESWLTYIIVHTFVEVPSDHSVKNVAAFMFGNDVPIEIE